ncbi:tripartite tricarboxylate transporter TctB family protein [Rubellimicrobium roseum]|uniref:Tripartite tricarboxylate transporter TctB family protein n=1 Tax=Rubellimicrobium roseum TaxID=687525 RepID=A0A5C4N685_9RHOB|nr:tripartite tricarboxylate transporter TctB family protein [Rubellimicrobium roseum]TNC63595.1 tripartite tricarboxylate transporter TctB family protein [Rubellimicrobium roseum]
MITRDMVGGAAASLIGALYLFYASQLRPSSLADSVGPQGLPLVYGWLTLALGLVLLAQAFIAVLRASPAERAKQADAWSGQGRRILWAAGLLAFAVGYLLIVETLGYLLSLAVLIPAVAIYLGARFGWRPLAVGVGGAVVLWLMFDKLLGVGMPEGVLRGLGL